MPSYLNFYGTPDFKKYRLRFNGYVRAFACDNKVDSNAINQKIIHSVRVANQIFHLGKAMGLDSDALETARIAGLFHDTGRFVQYRTYKTFNDGKSENHALLGIAEIEKYGLLDDLPEKTSRLIKTAIENHNKKTVPDIPDPETRFLTLLLRDADKLDIWRLMIAHVKKGDTGCHDPVTQHMPDKLPLSDGILDFLYKKESIPIFSIKNLNDFNAFLISWIFDLNFRPSLEAAKRRKIIQGIAALISDTSLNNNLINELVNWLDFSVGKKAASFSEFCRNGFC